MLFTSCFECNTQFVQAQIWDILAFLFCHRTLLCYPLDLKQTADFKTWHIFHIDKWVFSAESGGSGELTFVCCGQVGDWQSGGPVVHVNLLSGFRLQQHFHRLLVLSVCPSRLRCFVSISLRISAEVSFQVKCVCIWNRDSTWFSYTEFCISSANLFI